MRQFIPIILLLTVWSCETKNNDRQINYDTENKKPEIIQLPIKTTKIETEPKIIIKPFINALLESEIVNTYFVSDTIDNDFKFLIGIADKWTQRYQMMTHQADDNKLYGAYTLNDTLKIIPFFLGDYESQLFTKWKINPDSTLTYIGKINPILNSKYSFNRILEYRIFDQKEYFIGETWGGEGGGVWNIFWTAQYNGFDIINMQEHYTTGYDDDENNTSIEYEIKNNLISIYEKTDSVVQNNDNKIVIPLNRELVKVISIK